MSDALDILLTRRSVKAVDLQDPGPDAATLERILAAGIRVPDHGKLGPWRLHVFEGEARAQFGAVLANRFRELNPGAEDEMIHAEQGRFLRAPVVVAVTSRVLSGIKIPEWEQQLSSGAVCQNLLVAATLAGYKAQWLTEWYAYDAVVDRALGLEEDERVAGFVYIGSGDETPPERPRPTPEVVVSRWTPPQP